MAWVWAPGDVAMVRNEHDVWNRAICTVGLDGDTWRFGVALTEQPVEGSEARPLVVIDPEKATDIKRVIEAARGHGYLPTPGRGNMQRALRSLVIPPQPPEPTGRYAVVLDVNGVEWLRSREGIWAHTDASASHASWTTKRYADIAVVKVLSEGVTA